LIAGYGIKLLTQLSLEPFYFSGLSFFQKGAGLCLADFSAGNFF